MRGQPFATQLRRVLTEYERNGSIFEIPARLFFVPPPDAPYSVDTLFGRPLATPVGPSAGPHTQLSQNIISAWLCGGRFFELKTVQLNDDLIVPRPCIDMTDEGYNVEWSQELRLDRSAHEYVVAWAILHLLPRLLGWGSGNSSAVSSPGAIFDMSVGYTLDGICHPRMTRFLDVMADASEPIAHIRDVVRREFPQFADIDIPPSIAASVTLSTMHGCPPDEIERIARYLLEERGLHTVVKLNPTLLGRNRVVDILHHDLGFADIDVPEAVFDHDLQYDRAVRLITSLKAVASARGLRFGVKLSNTLAVRNHLGRLPGDEMYLSGRALYPVTMNLFDRLLRQFDGELNVSYSAGADAVNVPTILSCGALPVTACTDLLKPGGYGRLSQWLGNLGAAMRERGAKTLEDFSRDRLANVRRAAVDSLSDPRYRRQAFPHGLPKVSSRLGFWDCIVAPCVEACAVEQDVPAYAWLIAQGDYDRALEVILARNPLPGATGHVCTRRCETRCTRNDYEQPVAIRALKRMAEAHGRADCVSRPKTPTGHTVAVIGGGPSGLSAAAFLALSGVRPVVFEARDAAGGMMRAVPPFRLPQAVIDRDIARIAALGVEIRLNARICVPPEHLLHQGFDAVYLASGFQRDAPLHVPGVEGPGVMPALELLDRSRRGERVPLGSTVVVIGGGDTAMDAARTAGRITGHAVTILYRRTRREMPAAEEEVNAALDEGNVLEELVAPLEVLRDDGRVVGVRCVRNRMGETGPDGRRTPVAIAGSEFIVRCDAVVVAVGQLPELSFLDGSRVARHHGGGVLADEQTGSAGLPGVFAGGDVVVGPDSIIAACADGRRAAEAICAHFSVPFVSVSPEPPLLSDQDIVEIKRVRTRRIPQQTPAAVPAARRADFGLVEATFTDDQARVEALRCVQCATFCDKCVEVCPNRANYTFRTSPVRWTLPVLDASNGRLRVAGAEDFRIVQSRQILHVADFCNQCDNCQTFCMHQGRPYVDKPRLFLDAELFSTASDHAFRIEHHTIDRREQGAASRLTILDDEMIYMDAVARLRLTSNWRILEMDALVPFEGRMSLAPAAEMAVLFEGVRRSLPFLLLS